ncbi:MAG: transposase [Actinobacteria bacterium]|nr:transposase [Actinomycetota bacterium]MBU1943955.1 transposase [Actinomycetota bacterium]MBU2686957.1 transposase [Actinomycetota bacterium]
MARQERVQYEGAFYHVMSRGNDKKKVFVDDNDRWRFLKILGKVVKESGLLCHGYCLMGNHYHLFLETPDGNLSNGMQRLNSWYCHYFNSMHGKVGHVMQGRFKSFIVDDDDYLFRLLRYLCLNPVKDGFVGAPEHWRWSSYSAIAGLSRVPPFLDTSFTLALFSNDPQCAKEEFRSFIAEGMIDAREISDRKQLLKSLFEGVFDKHERDVAVRSAHEQYGFEVEEIAAYLGVHRTTISRNILKSCKSA